MSSKNNKKIIKKQILKNNKKIDLCCKITGGKELYDLIDLLFR
jgi:hypothetical protein